MTRLAFAGVSCVRGGRLLFEDRSFDLAPGDAALVTGPNGVGKSSLVRVAAGLLAPAAGNVTVAGRRALLVEASALDHDRPLAKALGFWAAIDGQRDAVRSAERRVGQECVRTCRSRWSPDHSKKKKQTKRS